MTTKPICRIGVAQRKINPPLESNLDGYFHRRLGKEVRSDLYTKAMVIEAEGRRIALVANDLCTTEKDFAQPAKQKIAATCGIPAEAVMISATHTHTAPALTQIGAAYDAVPGYVEMLAETIPLVVQEACSAMFEATLHLGQTEAEGYSLNKVWRLKNGRDGMNNSKFPMRANDTRIGIAGPLDPSVQALCVRDAEQRVRALAVNFAAHPNSSDEAIWAEWPGEMARVVASIYGEDVPCLFLQGTAGDVDCAKGLSKERIGRGIAGAAIMAVERESAPVTATPLDWRLRYITIPRIAKTPETDQMIEALRRKPAPNNLEQGWIMLYDAWDSGIREAQAPVQCLRIGEATAIVALPAEIFTALGLEIKRYSPARNTMVVELANELVSNYIPPVDQATRGSYGEWPFVSRFLVPEAATMITDAAIEMLHEMWGQTQNNDKEAH